MTHLTPNETFSLKEHLKIESVNDSAKLHLMYFFCKNFDKLKYHLDDLLEVLQPLPKIFQEKFLQLDSIIDVQKRMNYLYNIFTKGNYPFFFEFLYWIVLPRPILANLLVYVEDYLCIFETFIERTCRGKRYYDNEEECRLPTKKQLAEIKVTIEGLNGSSKQVDEKLKAYDEERFRVLGETFTKLREVQLYYPIRICQSLIRAYRLVP